MKNIIIFLFILCSFMTNGQSDDYASKIIIPSSSVEQSSTSGRRIARLAVDSRTASYSKTKIEETPWYKIDLTKNYVIRDIEFSARGLNDVYVFFSELPFMDTDISVLLDDPTVNYLYLDDAPTNSPIPTNLHAQYVLIISQSGSASLSFNNIKINGTVKLHNEICDNGIDDDGDGLVDCDDPQCGIGGYRLGSTCPSCATCSDGKICFKSRFANTLIVNGVGVSFPLNQWGFYGGCIDNLPAGEYDVELMNSFTGCSVFETVNLNCGFTSECDNLDFDNGDFTNWTGASADNNRGTLQNFVQGIDIPRFHEILPANNINDANAPNLNFGGITGNVARLGELNSGGDAGILTYCFDANSNVNDLFFFFAFVADNPNHIPATDNPFFEYRVFNGANNIIGPVRISSENPFLLNGPGNMVYSPFDCNHIDLGGITGPFCVEFISAGCGFSVHEGYTYLKLLCDGDGLNPSPTLQLNQVPGCSAVEAIGGGTLFNQSFFDIDGPNGIISTPITTGQNPTIADVVALYESQTSSPLQCGVDQLTVTFNAINSCADASVSESFTVPCPDPPVPGDLVSSVEGCDGAVVNVKGSGSNFTQYYFKISRVSNAGNVFGTITTPVVTGNNPQINDVIQLYVNTTGNNLNCEQGSLQVTMVLIEQCGIEAEKSINIEIPCLTWRAYLPNVFSPNSSNPVNQTFRLFFASPEYNAGQPASCDVYSNDITTVSYYRLFVFDRWGNLILDEEVSSSSANIDGSEIQWDGTFNGQQVVPGVYVWMAFVEDCGNYFRCNSGCPNGSYCSDGNTEEQDDQSGNPHQVEVFSGDVTMIL
jgi:hypothetical protein